MKLLAAIALLAGMMHAGDQTVYIGTRTSEGRSQGIYRAAFNPATGELSDVKLAAASIDPTFLAIHPTRPLLFAVVGVAEGKLRSFAIEPGGDLRLLNEVSSRGARPAHVQVDRSGQWVATANYQSGSAAVFHIEADGRLSEAVDWIQHEGKAPHPHSATFSADNSILYIADLGIDQVKRYGFDVRTGKLTPAEPLNTPPGSGPRHLALGRKRVYVVNELQSSVSVFEKGTLIETSGSLPPGFQGKSSAAEIVIDPSERFLYVSNRGADTIAVFRIARRLKKIADTPVGKIPRGFVLSPDGKFLLAASQTEDGIQTYRIDPQTGLLSGVNKPVQVGTPICLRFRPE